MTPGFGPAKLGLGAVLLALDRTEEAEELLAAAIAVETGPAIRRTIQPKTGRLILFPSYTWDGTLPFQGEVPRTAIAFDVLPA